MIWKRKLVCTLFKLPALSIYSFSTNNCWTFHSCMTHEFAKDRLFLLTFKRCYFTVGLTAQSVRFVDRQHVFILKDDRTLQEIDDLAVRHVRPGRGDVDRNELFCFIGQPPFLLLSFRLEGCERKESDFQVVRFLHRFCQKNPISKFSGSSEIIDDILVSCSLRGLKKQSVTLNGTMYSDLIIDFYDQHEWRNDNGGW